MQKSLKFGASYRSFKLSSYLAKSFSSSSESKVGGSSDAGDCGKDGPLPDSYSSSVGPVVGCVTPAGPVPLYIMLQKIDRYILCSG